MKNSLEEFVSRNREKFDVHEPPPELWKGIKKTLPEKKAGYLRFLKYAAVITIFFSGFYAGMILNGHGITLSKNKITGDRAEVIESKYYYQTEINEKLQELKPLLVNNPQVEDDLMKDLKELDDYCSSLQSDLRDNIDNEQVVDAMIRCYRMKLNILESLSHQLKKQNNENIKHIM